MGKLYFLLTDNTLADSYDIANSTLITDGKTIDIDDEELVRSIAHKSHGILKELVNPSIRMLLRYHISTKVEAVRVYYDSHMKEGLKLTEARDIVEKLYNEIEETRYLNRPTLGYKNEEDISFTVICKTKGSYRARERFIKLLRRELGHDFVFSSYIDNYVEISVPIDFKEYATQLISDSDFLELVTIQKEEKPEMYFEIII